MWLLQRGCRDEQQSKRGEVRILPDGQHVWRPLHHDELWRRWRGGDCSYYYNQVRSAIRLVNGIEYTGGLVPSTCDCPSNTTYAGMDNVSAGGPWKICTAIQTCDRTEFAHPRSLMILLTLVAFGVRSLMFISLPVGSGFDLYKISGFYRFTASTLYTAMKSSSAMPFRTASA